MNGSAYRGPKVVLTLDDAAKVLGRVQGVHGLEDVAEKIRTALASDPKWQEPTK